MAKTSPLDKLREKTADLKKPLFQQEIFIKSNLIVLPELRGLIPPLKEEEKAQLAANLLANGIKDPLAVWETTPAVVMSELDTDSVSLQMLEELPPETKIYVLIDGHNRYKLARQHGLDFRINIESFPDLSTVRDYMIDYQLGRRNLTPEQTSYLRGLRYNEMKEGNKFGREVNVAEKLAKEYNVSARTIKRDADFAKGLDELSPELKQNVLSGQTQLPRESVKALAKGKPDKRIESVDELTALLGSRPTVAEAGGEETTFEDAFSHSTQLYAAQLSQRQTKLKRLLGKDLSQKAVLKQLIREAKELLKLLN